MPPRSTQAPQHQLLRRWAWWEDTIIASTDVAALWSAALRRSVDVDEECGVTPAVSVPRSGADIIRDEVAVAAVYAQLPLRTTPRGWELTSHPSTVWRRTRGWLRELSDGAEELVAGRAQRILLHVPGPWTFGASVEYRGHAVMRDRPAFRDCALALGAGVAEQVRWWQRALDAEVAVVVHEPLLGSVATGLPGATDFDTLPPVPADILCGVWRRLLGQLSAASSGGASGAGEERVGVILNAGTGAGAGAAADSGTGLPAALLSSATGRAELVDTGFDRVVIPSTLCTTHQGRDEVGALIGAGQRIAWADAQASWVAPGVAAAQRNAHEVARRVTQLWAEWTFPDSELTDTVDIVVPRVPSSQRTFPAASEAAAVARTAAEYLWRN